MTEPKTPQKSGYTEIPDGTPRNPESSKKMETLAADLHRTVEEEDDDVQKKLAAMIITQGVSNLINRVFSPEDSSEILKSMGYEGDAQSNTPFSQDSPLRRKSAPQQSTKKEIAPSKKSGRDSERSGPSSSQAVQQNIVPDAIDEPQSRTRSGKLYGNRVDLKPARLPNSAPEKQEASKYIDEKDMLLSKLAPIQLSFSSDTLVDQISGFRAEMVKRMLEARFNTFAKNTRNEVTFTTEQIESFTNLVFTDILGVALRDRLQAIVSSISKKDDDSQQYHVAQRAQALSTDSKSPNIVRDLFASVGSTKLAAMDPKSMTGKIIRMIYDVEFSNMWEKVKDAYNSGDDDVKDWVAGYGLKTSQGISSKSLLVNAFNQALNIKNFHNLVQRGKILSKWVDMWGYGVIAVVPASFQTRLKNLGVGANDTAILIINDTCPIFERVCTLANEKIIDPIRKGQPLKLKAPKNEVMSIVELFGLEDLGKEAISKMFVDDKGSSDDGIKLTR